MTLAVMVVAVTMQSHSGAVAIYSPPHGPDGDFAAAAGADLGHGAVFHLVDGVGPEGDEDARPGDLAGIRHADGAAVPDPDTRGKFLHDPVVRACITGPGA